ncbi:MAG: hypothetical protein ACJAT9_000494 [Polaribacter sp.]|jgi:hypothetical protein|tara:strand:- start:1268 stop:1447 length:180 start_codon:yes stop_codon:yes gene_type:complete
MIFSWHTFEIPFRTENRISGSTVAFDKLKRSLSERVAMIKSLVLVHMLLEVEKSIFKSL